MDLFDRLAKIIDAEGEADIITALQAHKIWSKITNDAVEGALSDGEVVSKEHFAEETSDLNSRIEELEGTLIIAERDAADLHDAICEGRRQDAIDILNEVTGDNYRSVREQANLFPGRVAS